MDISPEFIVADQVAKIYQTNGTPVPAVGPTCVSLKPGETIAVVGPSGCGKSTLLLLLAGLEPPTEGSIRFKGNPLNRPHRDVALVLQDYGLFPWKTVIENVTLGLKIRSEPIDHGRLTDLLEDLGIADKTDAYPQQLSGGQKQRVALARALIVDPAVMLLDEPFAALDTLTRERLQDLVARAWEKRAFAMALVTHNIQEATRLGSRILVMSGRPGIITHEIPNPRACEHDYRASDEFYAKCREVRYALEETL